MVNSLTTRAGLTEPLPVEPPDELRVVARRRGVEFAVSVPRATHAFWTGPLPGLARHLRLWSRSPNGIRIALEDPPQLFRPLPRP